MRRTFAFVFASFLFAGSLAADAPRPGALLHLPGSRLGGTITRDAHGIPYVYGLSAYDLYFLEGYAHAQDRFFQMDYFRHLGSGTLAELLGPAALSSDAQFRVLGIRRSASAALLAASPEAQDELAGYAAGVNAWLASNALPPEYAAIELTKVAPWTEVDSLTIAKFYLFYFSFDDDTTTTRALLTYQAAGQLLGFDGAKLYFEDLFRSAPFDSTTTIPPSAAPSSGPEPLAFAATRPRDDRERFYQEASKRAQQMLDDGVLDLLDQYHAKVQDVPVLKKIHDRETERGSNEWVIAGSKTTSGAALHANDTHFPLGTPTPWYTIALRGPGLNVVGDSFAGVPYIVLGHNERVSWTATIDPLDVTDWYQEKVVIDAASGRPVGTIYKGNVEPVTLVAESFRYNVIGDGTKDNLATATDPSLPAASVIVPRRNNGPIVSLNLTTGAAISVAYTGNAATREVDAIRSIMKVKSIDEFKAAVPQFNVGSINFVVSDTAGGIGYFTNADLPLREDLDAGTVHGLPPYFLRDGINGGNEWVPLTHPQPGQSVPFDILPFAEKPQIVNPASGYIANSNNDPIGVTLGNQPISKKRANGGFLYLAPYYTSFRISRVDKVLKAKLAAGKVSFADMQALQADTTLVDAQYFTPYILQAFQNGHKATADPRLAGLAASPAIGGAVQILSGWDYTSPTGIPEGYDASDPIGNPPTPPTQTEIVNSVGATFYAAWRSALIANTIDAVLAVGGPTIPRPDSERTLSALKNLLDNFPTRKGRGASGVQFFNVQNAASDEDRRDIIILKSLADALTMLTSEEFRPAFGRSQNLLDYRWGRLHRVVFAHPLGANTPFSIPPAGGAFPAPLDGLPGIPYDGGFQTVDNASHEIRAKTVNGFMFNSSGPARRYVAEMHGDGIVAQDITPGGASGVVGNPHFFDQLLLWLTNDALPIYLQTGPRLPWQ